MQLTDLAITDMLDEPLDAAATPRWPWPVVVAVVLHVSALLGLLWLSQLPQQIAMSEGVVIPVTLFAAAPRVAKTAAPEAATQPQTKEISHPQPEPPAAHQTTVASAETSPVLPKPAVHHPLPTPRETVQPQAVASPKVRPAVQPKPHKPADQPRPQVAGPTASPAPAAPSSAPVAASPHAVTLAGAAGGTGMAKAATAVVPAHPRYQDNPAPPYPEAARRRQMQGTVVLSAMVNGHGRVDSLNVQASSGYDLLDRAALRAVKDWLFTPGTRGGSPVTMTVLVPVRFALR